MSKPPVSITTIQPFDNGQLVYLAAVPMAAGETQKSRLHFSLKIKNNGLSTETLEKIVVVLSSSIGGSIPPQHFSFDRQLQMSPGATISTAIAWNEEIWISGPAFNLFQISLFFSGHDEPILLGGVIGSHHSPTPQGSYRFFGQADDMGLDEYFVQSRHKLHDGQFFGYDVGVQKWVDNGLTAFKPGTSHEQNEDYFAYGKPLHALADGTVISVINNIADNPAPGKRALIRITDAEAGLVSVFSLARLSSTRMATAVRTAAGTLKIIVWEFTTPGNDVVNSQLTRLGSIEAGESISSVVAVALSTTRFVTVVRLVSGAVKLIVWQIAPDGMSLTRLGDDEAEVISQLAAVKLASSRLAVAVITAKGTLKVIVWDVLDAGQTLARRGDAQAGAIARLDMAALSKTRLVTAVRTQSNTLKLIVWDIADNGAITRKGDADKAGIISDLSLTRISGNAVGRTATAVRTADNQVKLAYWDIDEPGSVQPLDEFEIGEALAIKVAPVDNGAEDNDAATCMVTESGTLQLTTWKYTSGNLSQSSQNSAGTTDLIDLVSLHNEIPHYLVTAVRTAQQTLKLIVWFLAGGGGNHLLILHGDELVYMAHMQNGSIHPALSQPGATVKLGQFVGKLGNSGSSGGPHLHIHASQAPLGLSVDEMIVEHQSGTLGDKLTYRPMPFHNAQAMRKQDVVPGAANNGSFAKVDGNGFYWEPMAIWPGLTTPGIPTGR